MLYRLGRLFQLAGLIILPVAIAGNVAERLTLWQSLSLSAAGVTVFYFGKLLQERGK